MVYKNISWHQILEIWQHQLWPERNSAIETHSAMMWPFGGNPEYDISVFERDVYFVGACHKHRLVGVNSGHLTSDTEYRTRGLWIDPEYRGRGIAQTMFAMLENHAVRQGAIMLWSVPRISALPSYERYGFQSVGEPFATETAEANIYARKFI